MKSDWFRKKLFGSLRGGHSFESPMYRFGIAYVEGESEFETFRDENFFDGSRGSTGLNFYLNLGVIKVCIEIAVAGKATQGVQACA